MSLLKLDRKVKDCEIIDTSAVFQGNGYLSGNNLHHNMNSTGLIVRLFQYELDLSHAAISSPSQ